MDQDNATPEQEQPAAASKPEAASKDAPKEDAVASDKTTLVVVKPFFTVSFQLPQDDGDTLVIDRHGSEVPSADVDKIIEAAARAGVTLARK